MSRPGPRLVLALSLGLSAGPMATSVVAQPVASEPRGDTPAEALDPRVQIQQADMTDEGGPLERGERLWQALLSFYQARELRPAWTLNGRLTRAGEALAGLLAAAAGEGLEPADYDWTSPPRATLASAGQEAAEADPDVRLTYAALKYLGDVTGGRLRPRGVSPYWFEQPSAADVPAELASLSQDGGLTELLAHALPLHPQYRALREWLQVTREQVASGGWPALPGSVLGPDRSRAGSGKKRSDGRVELLRQRLARSGDLPEAATSAAAGIDAVLAGGIRHFQERHGLAPTGRVDEATLAALNVPPSERLRQIELNMERWRWLPRRLGERYLIVNIPTFELVAFENDRPVLSMRIVTGRAGDTPTPVFSRQLTSVVFSPSWTVPPGMTANEVLPAILRDRSYVRRHNLQVVRGTEVVRARRIDWSDPGIQLRQPPGATNPLGRVKFLLPNPFNVYLHDTPARSLFDRSQRDFSHGCMRVQKPFELAQFVLQGSAWTPQRIRAAMSSGVEQGLPVPVSIPVYVTYFTTWVEPDGSVRYAPDVYGHDAVQGPALASRGRTGDLTRLRVRSAPAGPVS